MHTAKCASAYPGFYPLDDMYYTLDYDVEDWEIEKNKKLQNAKNSIQSTPDEGSQRSRSKGNTTSSRELRSLLSDVKTKKRQPVNYIYEGQEELYESLDNVLTKLKDYSEHSYPFLTKVRTSDARDYYEVIKKPMDLGLMTKKLKRGDYSSKSEFQADLNLIYTNCRIYNTDPSSRIYLEHADHLERRSKELMKQVKNIDFSKERKIREATMATVTSPSAAEEEETPPPQPPPPLSKPSKNTPKQKSPDSKEKEQKVMSPISPMRVDLSDLDNESISSKTDLYRCLTRQYRLQRLAHLHEQDKLPFGERDAIIRDPHRMTKFMMLNGNFGIPKKEIPGLKTETTTNSSAATTTTTTTTASPTPLSASTSSATSEPPPSNPPDSTTPMETDQLTTPTKTTSEKEPTDKTDKEGESPKPVTTSTIEDELTREVGFFPELCFFADSVPELHPCIYSSDESADEREEDASKEAKSGREAKNSGEATGGDVIIKTEEQHEDQPRAKRATPSPPTTTSTPPITETGDEKETQETKTENTAIPTPTTNSTPSSSSHPPPSSLPPPNGVTPHDEDEGGPAPSHFPEYYHALMRRTVATMLSKSGFIGVGSSYVMDVFADVANGYFLRLGRLLRAHTDDYGAHATMEEVFSRVLCEMGVAGLAELRDFVQNMGTPSDRDLDEYVGFDFRSRERGDYEYEDGDEEGQGNEYSEEELVSGTISAENAGSGRQRRQVTKISERDNMYEYYEEEAQAELGGLPGMPSPHASQRLNKPKKIIQKKSVKPQPIQKKRKNLVQNVNVTKKKK